MEKRDNLQIPRSEKKGEKEVLQVPEQLLFCIPQKFWERPQ